MGETGEEVFCFKMLVLKGGIERVRWRACWRRLAVVLRLQLPAQPKEQELEQTYKDRAMRRFCTFTDLVFARAAGWLVMLWPVRKCSFEARDLGWMTRLWLERDCMTCWLY